jgi:hypothetical protein
VFRFHEASLHDQADESVIRFVEQDIAHSAKLFTRICRNHGLSDQIAGALCHIAHLQGVRCNHDAVSPPRAWPKWAARNPLLPRRRPNGHR